MKRLKNIEDSMLHRKHTALLKKLGSLKKDWQKSTGLRRKPGKPNKRHSALKRIDCWLRS